MTSDVSRSGGLAARTPARIADATRGRPLGFERDELADALMRAFWQLGWSGASIPKLEQLTGVARSSLANTIGRKPQLLVVALERYLQVVDDRLIAPLREGRAGLADVDAFFQRLREGKRTAPGGWGCLMAITMTEVGVDVPAAADLTLRYREALTVAFGAAIARAESLGEVTPGGADGLAPGLTSAAIGLNVAARAGASDAELDQIVAAVALSVEQFGRRSTGRG